MFSRAWLLLENSRLFCTWANGQRAPTIRAYRAIAQPENLVDIPFTLQGMLATWTPTGEYMTSCLLDRFRFQVQKPQMGVRLENAREDSRRRLYGLQSCAEWIGFLKWLHSAYVFE
ncbi:hypothetical protein GGR54DRAFT_53070 [Hypoxylon sp. NC1633]|nr:hypothetical protein GGR54DRAFT_53070 [Hypoxylon sp. NC1633]